MSHWKKSRPREPHSSAAENGFVDPRSRVQWRTGRVRRRGEDMTELRRQVYKRAGGRCARRQS